MCGDNGSSRRVIVRLSVFFKDRWKRRKYYWKFRIYVDTKYICIVSYGVTDYRVQLIDYLRFYVPLKNISLIWRRHHCRWRAAKFRPMLGAQGLWAGRDLYRATPPVTRGLGFSCLIRRTAPISRLLRHAWGYGGPVLTRVLTGFPVFEFLLNVK
jgi:hypothetical protein